MNNSNTPLNFKTNINFILANISIFIILAYFAFTKGLFKDSSNAKFVKYISYILFSYFALFSAENIFKVTKIKHLFNIILSIIIIVILIYAIYFDNVFIKGSKNEKFFKHVSHFSLVYVFVWVLLKSLNEKFEIKKGDLRGMQILLVMIISLISTLSFGKVYHKDVSNGKKTITVIGATGLLASSLIMLNYYSKSKLNNNSNNK